MSYNGSGTFTINSTGQPVVAGTVITASAFNALTTDLATGLTTAITKDGQTTTTARITFAQGITSSLVTDSSSVSTGSIITDGGVGIAKNVYVGGTLNVTGSTTLTNPVINNIKMGYSTTATAAGTTTLTVASNYRQFFTGSTTQTIVLPVTSTLVTGIAYEIENNSTGLLTVNSSGGNLVGTIPAGVCAHAVCIGTTLTTAADWDWDYISTSTITGTGANVLGTSPTITTPTISSLSSAAATALTLQSAGTTAITVNTSQNVGIGLTSPSTQLHVKGSGSGTFGSYQDPVIVEGNTFTYLQLKGNTGGGGVAGIIFNKNGSTGYLQTLDNSGNMKFSYLSTMNETGITTAKDTGTPSLLLDTSGNLLVGTTTVYNGAKATFESGGSVASFKQTAAGGYVANYYATVNSGTYYYSVFYAAGTQVGSITSTSSTTSYVTTSDYRLKENISPMTGALAKVAQLKPVTYKWKIDGSDGEGFIAHELVEVCPSAVSGEKDAVETYLDDEGNEQTRIKPQGIDTSFLVATLTAAIQELKTINDTQAETINALTARITALENA
jgi:hypothetical protein